MWRSDRHDGLVDSYLISEQGGAEAMRARGSWTWTTAEWAGPHRTVIGMLRIPVMEAEEVLRNNEDVISSDRQKQQ
jgi:hypothetical protein